MQAQIEASVAPDHHTCRARLPQRLGARARINNVPIGDHRQADALDHRRDPRPVRVTLIELLTRAPVHRNHPRALALGDARDLRRVER